MHEGYLFFSLMWLGCWYFIFISDETIEVRRRGLTRLLVGICFAGLSIPVFTIHINLFLIAAIIWAFYQWGYWTNIQLIMGTVSIICIAIALICFRIFSVLYPVWFIVNWIFFAAPLLVGIGCMLLKPTKRISILVVAIILGETAYSGILFLYGFPIKDIGSFETLDLLLLSLTIAAVLNKAQIVLTRMPGRKIYHQQQIGVKGRGIR